MVSNSGMIDLVALVIVYLVNNIPCPVSNVNRATKSWTVVDLSDALPPVIKKYLFGEV